MPTVESDITIDAPVDRVYQAWTNYESFPTFMQNVKSVRRTGTDMTHWVMEAAGQKLEWDAKTTEEDRRRVAWRAQGETGQSGEVRFESLEPNKTRLRVKMDYSLPSNVKETVAKVFQIDDMVVKKDLNNFKDMIENRAGATGGNLGKTGPDTTGTRRF